MSIFNRDSITIAILGTSMIVVAAAPGIAYSQEKSPWSVKAYGVFGSANESFSADRADGGRAEAGGDGILGIGGAIEYRLSDLIGLELAGSFSKVPDIDFESNSTTTEVGEGPEYAPIQLGVNFHFMTSDKLDVYAGPRIAYAAFGDFDIDVDGQRLNYEVDDEFGVGALAGVSYRIGNGPVALTAEVSYYSVEMNVTETGSNTTESLDFDPVAANLGITYQF